MKKFISLIISLLLVLPPPAWAATRTFKPKIAGFFGSVEFNSLYEKNETKSSTYSTESSDTAFREVLKLGTTGYFYHPNLVTFLLKASEAVEQEKYETDNKGDWRAFTSEAYEARAFVLPTHPYNLEVFSVLSRPLIAGNLAGSGSGRERQRHGTYFRYRKRPWSGSLNWTHDRLKASYTGKNNTYWADATFYKYTYLHGTARYADAKNSDGSSGENTQFTLSNQHSLKIFNLHSSWQQNGNHTGDKFAGSETLRQRRWSETLDMPLPDWNLQPVVSYSVDRTKSDRLTMPDTETKNFINSEGMQASINHTLYRSIYSNAHINQTITDSSSGKNTMTNAKGNIDYRKQIYRGSFGADVWKSYNNLDRMGSLTLLQDQAYKTTFPNPEFNLDDKYVDENTIQIKIITDPAGALDEETLIKNIHYTVNTSVETTQITIGPVLPGLYVFGPALKNYTLLITYSFLNTNFELETESQGFSLRLSALDSLLNPHYAYSRSTQKLIDGILPGGLNNSEAHTVGLTVNKDPYSAGIEYTRIFASRNPEKRWYGIVEYREDLTESTKLRARVESERTTYYLGDDQQPDESKEPEKLYRATLDSYTNWPKRFLSMNVGVFYSRRIWEVNSSVYSLFSNFNWRLGKVDVTMGANYSDTTSTTNTGNTTDTNTMVFYLNIKRKLF